MTDEMRNAFLDRPIGVMYWQARAAPERRRNPHREAIHRISYEGPYLWIDAPSVTVRSEGRIVSKAVIGAGGVNTDGRREVRGLGIGPSEAETFGTAFLRKLARRGLRGVKLVISDAHAGIKASVATVMNATWQPCRVHFMREALAHAGRSGPRVVSAFITTAFAQDDAEAAREQGRRVADRLRPKVPKLAALMDKAEVDVLACRSVPAAHRASFTARTRWSG